MPCQRLRPLLLAAAVGISGGLMVSGPTHAEFLVCNQLLDVVNVALGQQLADSFRTEGWWTIGANQCATVIRGALRNRYVFVYATDVFGQAVLEGTSPMCVDDRRFTIQGTESCWQRGFREAGFVEVDTQDVDHWTLFLSEHLAD